MSRRDPFDLIFEGIFGAGPRPEPTTNAGRYLRQLANGDTCFARNSEQVEQELEAAIRRIQIVSRREVQA